jgi:hypothetical protein
MSAVKFSSEDASKILSRLDTMAETIKTKFASWGMSQSAAKDLVNGLDRIADEIEVAAFGPESLQARQVEVLKQAKVIQKDSDEGYMGAFSNPMEPIQTEGDEGYMSAFKDDQSSAVSGGKASNGRPLAPGH